MKNEYFINKKTMMLRSIGNRLPFFPKWRIRKFDPYIEMSNAGKYPDFAYRVAIEAQVRGYEWLCERIK